MIGKMTSILVCLLFVLTTVSTVPAFPVRTLYKDCYIEANGSCGHHNKIHIAGFNMWIIQWLQPNVTVTIYDSKGGQMLWTSSEGPVSTSWSTRLLFFKGDYNFTNSTATLAGTAKIVIKSYEKNWWLP